MTTTGSTSVHSGVPTSARRLLKIGAWGWIVVGGGHTLADIASRLQPATNPALQRVDDLARATPFPMFDFARPHRSYGDIIDAISFGLGVSMVTVGALLLELSRRSDPDATRRAASIGVGASGIMFAVNAAFNPLLQIAMTGGTFAAFGAGWLRLRKTRGKRAT